jgi:hypothetical protein
MGSGSSRKYLLYAVGEIGLVVIGILIALQINNWHDSIKLRQKEKAYLEEILTNLEEDHAVIRGALEFSIAKDSVISNTLKTIVSVNSNLEVAQYISSQMPFLTSFRVFTQNRIAFNNMLSAQTIDIISDDSLRAMISLYYSDQILDGGSQERVKELTRDFVDYATPLLMNRENIVRITGELNNFKSASDIPFRSDQVLYGSLFGMQRNLKYHIIFLRQCENRIVQLSNQIERFLSK